MLKGLNAAWGMVTFAGAGTASGTWQHLDQIAAGSAAEQVELNAAPPAALCRMVETSNAGGLTGVKSLTTLSKTGFTVTSTHPGDTSTVYVYAKVRELPQVWEV